MKRSRLAVGFATAAFMAASVVLAYAAGLFNTFPILGSAAFSIGTVTVPAGPSALTGNELIPADTRLSQGRQPQTITIPPMQLGASLPSWATICCLASNNLVISPNVASVILQAAGTITQVSVQMPASAMEGQRVRLSSTQTVTSLNISPNTGQAIQTQGLATSMTVSTVASYGYEFMFRALDSTWYRLQ